MARELAKAIRLDSLVKVLIVEDDEDDVLIIEDRLGELVSKDCEFVSCCDKQQAIDALKTKQYDLCLLDHRLGYFDGIEVLDALDEDLINTPIIMLTGQNDFEVESQAIKKGAQDYINKSAIDSEVFAKSIRYAVSRKELEFARISGERFRSENVAKDKFIAHLSHELRTPLTSILGYTSLLLEHDKAAPLHKELSIIANNGKHLLNLLNDVLDLSKIAAGKFELQPAQSNLHQLMAEVYSLLSVNALDKGLALECKTLTPIPEQVTVDELRLKQVLINLISNAIKFTDEGYVRLHLAYDEHGLHLHVIDSGIGMAESQIDMIFQPFEQIEDVANRKAGGAGLGLSICSQIIKQMGGSIKLDSMLGEGSSFEVQLPIESLGSGEGSHIDFELYKDQSNIVRSERFSAKVLICDDVFEIRQLLGQLVKQVGCDVHFARNGQAALESVRTAADNNAPFDLVLLDLHMPLMTGQEAAQAMQAQYPELAIVAVTAAIQKGTREHLFKQGFSELLAKPIDRERLLKVLTKFLAEPQQSASDKLQSDAQLVLIEDDADSAALMTTLLASLGFKVRHFATGQACLDALQDLSGCRFLLDLGLPDMEGEHLVAQVRQAFADAPIIILSGSQADPELIKRHNVQAHLLKPVSLAQLKALL